MNKTVIAFDLDDTLAESKSAIDLRMKELLIKLLTKFNVCIISGGKFEQFQKQVLNELGAIDNLTNLHLMPTCGTRYYVYKENKNNWSLVYAEDFTNEEKVKIKEALFKTSIQLGYDKQKKWGEDIEDRGSQITYSALGQKAPSDQKYSWDKDGQKKKKIRDIVATYLPEFEVRSGGTTSIDVTKRGIDKAYGMKKLTEILNINKSEILFFGDALIEGGNDYPVKLFGIDSIQVSDWHDTAKILESILYIV